MVSHFCSKNLHIEMRHQTQEFPLGIFPWRSDVAPQVFQIGFSGITKMFWAVRKSHFWSVDKSVIQNHCQAFFVSHVIHRFTFWVYILINIHLALAPTIWPKPTLVQWPRIIPNSNSLSQIAVSKFL